MIKLQLYNPIMTCLKGYPWRISFTFPWPDIKTCLLCSQSNILRGVCDKIICSSRIYNWNNVIFTVNVLILFAFNLLIYKYQIIGSISVWNKLACIVGSQINGIVIGQACAGKEAQEKWKHLPCTSLLSHIHLQLKCLCIKWHRLSEYLLARLK